MVRRDGEDVVHPGGSPLNVAVGLQRLGLPTTLHSAFGADPHGVAIAQHLEASGVSVTASTVSDRETSVALATLGADGAATYTFSIDWDPAAPDVAGRDVRRRAHRLDRRGARARRDDGRAPARRCCGRRTTISFDPNVRPQ